MVVTLDAMLRAYAINGGPVATTRRRNDRSSGVGKAADLVVLDKNLEAIGNVDINTTRVLLMFVDGVQVYAREAAR